MTEPLTVEEVAAVVAAIEKAAYVRGAQQERDRIRERVEALAPRHVHLEGYPSEYEHTHGDIGLSAVLAAIESDDAP